MTAPSDTFDRDNLAPSNLSDKVTSTLMAKDGQGGIEHWDSFKHKDLGELVSTYPHDLLMKIDKLIAPTEENPNGYKVNVFKLYVLEEAPAERINEALYFLPLFDQNKSNSARAILASLHQYQQLPQSNDYSREDPSTIAQCAALIHVACSLSHLYNIEDLGLEIETLFNGDWTLADEQLAELVLAHPEHGEQIRDLIIEREHVNIDLIKTMLANETPVLNKGIL
jgi:hypothetical protein